MATWKIGDKVHVWREDYIGEVVNVKPHDNVHIKEFVYTVKPLMKKNKFIKNGSERGYVGETFLSPLTEKHFDEQINKLALEIQILERNKRFFFK